MKLTDEQIEELKRWAEKATPGPWETCRASLGNCHYCSIFGPMVEGIDNPLIHQAVTFDDAGIIPVPREQVANAKLFAAARDLLDTVLYLKGDELPSGNLKWKMTDRGFGYAEFIDLYGSFCSIQKSSIATEDAIWFGIDRPNNARMHLTREQVAGLLPVLKFFADTGELPVPDALVSAGEDKEKTKE